MLAYLCRITFNLYLYTLTPPPFFWGGGGGQRHVIIAAPQTTIFSEWHAQCRF